VEQVAAFGVAALLIFSGTDGTVAANLEGQVHAASTAEGLILSCGLSSGVVEESSALELVQGWE
jgi:hypothetical protein